MQQQQIIREVLSLLEKQGMTTRLENVAQQLNLSQKQLAEHWPEREALLYDCLNFHAQQIDIWHQQLLEDITLSPTEKLLAHYSRLVDSVQQQRYPGCLFIAACSFFPDQSHAIHQLAKQQKLSSYQFILNQLRALDIDDADMVAKQMGLVLEGCLSKLLVDRKLEDIESARRLAEDILHIAYCRKNGALS